MKVFRSNHIEILLEELFKVVRTPLSNPIRDNRVPQPESIIVQSEGIATWISMELAKRLGIWAHPAFSFPKDLILVFFEIVLGETREQLESFRREKIVWAIMELLPEYFDHPAFQGIRNYVKNDSQNFQLFQLSRQIANLFDDYMVYRPEMVVGWENELNQWMPINTEAWQPVLWKALINKIGNMHTGALANQFFQKIKTEKVNWDAFPQRICLFDLSILPPLFMEIIDVVSNHIPVNLFLLSPSRKERNHIHSKRETIRKKRKQEKQGKQMEEESRWVTGNPLLDSMGKVGRDFQFILEEFNYEETYEHDSELYRNPGTDTMLHTLQSDILFLRERKKGLQTTPLKMSDWDDSIVIHSCHNPMREVEILRDQLLDLLTQGTQLAPEDILIMTPDLETYAPLLEAVLEKNPKDSHWIPYCLIDHSIRNEDEVIEAFFRILELIDSRLNATQVLDLLSLKSIRNRFEISHDDLEKIREWIQQSGIRWGVNQEHRKHHQQPDFQENTWHFGLERLMLGYALPGDGEFLFQNILPFDELEGGDTEIAGNFVFFCERLFQVLKELSRPKKMEEWRKNLGEILDEMMHTTPENHWQFQWIRKALNTLVENTQVTRFQGKTGHKIITFLLEDYLKEEPASRGFLSGGATVCGMRSMRGIPFQVIYLLGMNEEVFPQSQRPYGFDLMAKQPRTADHSVKNRERYLFLEVLLSARQQIIISYRGQSEKDKNRFPPSVVVSELLDVLYQSFYLPTDCENQNEEQRFRKFTERLVRKHFRQPYHVQYFQDSTRWFSYSETFYEGAKNLQRQKRDIQRFLSQQLNEPEEKEATVLLKNLLKFFRNPTEYLIKDSLGLIYSKEKSDLQTREPMEIRKLERYRIGDRVLQQVIQNVSDQQGYHLLRAEGMLPLGSLGEYEYRAMLRGVKPIRDQVMPFLKTEKLPDLEILIDWKHYPGIRGMIENRRKAGLLRYRYSKISGQHLLELWIQHLILCWYQPKDQTQSSILVGRPEKKENQAQVSVFQKMPSKKASVFLQDLLQLYRIGQREPLLFFPGMSWFYTQTFMKTKDEEQAYYAVQKLWEGDNRQRGERENIYLWKAFGELPVLKPGFALFKDSPMKENSFPELSKRVFQPILESLEKNKGS